MSSTSRSVSRSVVRALRTVSLAIVLLAAQAAGQSVKLNAPLFHFLDFYFEDGVLETRVSSDGRWCVYRAKEKSQEPGLFSVRVDGSESVVWVPS